jgi:hypothetical protein
MMDPESHGPCDQSKKTATRVLHMQNYSRALTLFSATGPLGTVLKAVLECDQIASKLSDKIAAVSERWEWSNLNDESSVEWTTLISDFDSDEGPWSLKSFEKKKLKSADFDKWDVTLRIKVLGGVFTILNDESDRRYSEICTALGNLKNHGRNKVIHSGPAEWRETAYGNLKKTVLNGIKKLLDSEENVQSLQQLKEDIPKWIEFIVQGKCCMLNSKAKRNSIRELMKVIKDHLDKSSADDLKKIKDHFGLDEETEAASLLVYISTELPDDHRRQVRRFISKFMPDREALILNTPPHHNAWLEGYTVTYKFLEHVKADETVNQYQQTIAENFSAVFQHIRYGCTELSFVMEDIHAHCLPVKILDPNNFDMLQLQEQRPVVTVFGCLAFSPSKDQYWPYFMGTKDIHDEILKEYDALIHDKDVSQDQKKLLKDSKKIIENLKPLEDDPSEGELSEVLQPIYISSAHWTQMTYSARESPGPPVLEPIYVSSDEYTALLESLSRYREQMTHTVKRQTSSIKPPGSLEEDSSPGSLEEHSSPGLLKEDFSVPPVPLPPMSPDEPALLESPSRYREQRTHAVSGAEVRSRRVKRLAVVFCNNITKEEYAQKSKCWYDALIQRDFHVQVAQDATLSTFEAFCEDCEGCECVAFVFNGVSSSTGQSINLKSGERTEQSMTNLSQKIINSLLINPKLKHCRIMMFFDTTNPIQLKIIIDGVTESAKCVAQYIAAASGDKGDFSENASKALGNSSTYDAFERSLRAAISEVGKIYTNSEGAKWDLRWSTQGTPPSRSRKKVGVSSPK